MTNTKNADEGIPLIEGLNLLCSLLAAQDAPEQALQKLRAFKTSIAGTAHSDLIWEQNPLSKRWEYNLLLDHPPHGKVTLSVVPDDGVPFPLRRLQSASDMLFVQVNGHNLMTYDAMGLFDSIWEDHPLIEQIINFCLIRRALELDPIDDVPLDELQREMDRFRIARGLLTVEATDEYLRSRGQILADVEEKLSNQIRLRMLRHRQVGQAARSAFEANPGAYRQITLLAFPVASEQAAKTLAAKIAGGADFWQVAHASIAAHRGERRASRSISSEVMSRNEIATLASDQDLVVGGTYAAMLRGKGPYLVKIEDVRAADWDSVTRESIETELFGRWLAEQRATAHIKWNWGERKTVATE